MIADFVWPKVQDGWLECDGSDISTSTYGALYDVMTIQTTGTRVIATATITSLSSTTSMRVGYYVFGTGITSGTTIASIDSGTQITLSSNVSSSGTSTIVVSPWFLNTGTIRLPNLMDASVGGRYRRTKRSDGNVGTLLGSTNLAHTHTGSGSTGNDSPGHNHNFSGTTSIESNDHTHSVQLGHDYVAAASNTTSGVYYNSSTQTSGQSDHHTHTYNGTTNLNNQYHQHSYSFTTTSSGDTESRPVSMTVMTCVKT